MIPTGFWTSKKTDLIETIIVDSGIIDPETILTNTIKISKYEITHTQFRWIMNFDPPEVI